jgi:hypothetical protein
MPDKGRASIGASASLERGSQRSGARKHAVARGELPEVQILWTSDARSQLLAVFPQDFIRIACFASARESSVLA